jgi:redox-sensing transcriptional repressor
VVVVGAGNIGSALLTYGGFAEQGFDVVAVFDQDARRVGQKVGEFEVLDTAKLADVARARGADIGVIATPARAAQAVAAALVEAGVRGILNFAPRKLFVPDDVPVRTVDMTMEFESLSFALTQARAPRRRRTGRESG